ncbi:MAG: type II secretion system protein GspJ [Elusimicrobiota bacterium]
MRRSGYTLIEFLLALGIFAAVGLALAASLRAGVDAWRKGEEAGRVNHEARRVLEEMGLELRNMISLPKKPLEGKQDLLSFDAVLDMEKAPGIFRVVYRVDQETGGLLRELRTYAKKEGEEEKPPKPLTARPGRMVFEYPYPDPEVERTTLWKEEWESETKLPRGVRVRLTLQDRYGRAHAFLRTMWIPLGAWP